MLFGIPGSAWPMLKLISLLADIGFAATLILLALLVLSVRGHARVALCWGSGMLLGLGVTLVIKRLMAHDLGLPHFPSGHVALAVTFYGGLALVLFRDEFHDTPWRSAILLAILAAVAFTQGISRVVLTEHDWIDVAGGFAIGVAALALTGNPLAWKPIDRKDRLWLAGVLLTALPFAGLLHPLIDPSIRTVAGV